MKAEDFKNKTADELKAQLVDLKKEQFNLRFQLSQGQLENTSRIRAVRRDIARVTTFLSGQGGEAQAAPKKAAKATKAKAAPKAKKAGGKKSAA